MACCRQRLHVIFGSILVAGVIIVYLEGKRNDSAVGFAGRQTVAILDEAVLLQSKGRANLHVFEDWCGSSVADLRKNIHYPLYPHAKTTVQKLAVSPEETNYGLRMFGYLHPFTDGEFVFAVSSDDNSEFWLSTDESPGNVEQLASVGKTGAEWTLVGEFTKFASQTSRPVRLSAGKKYFFEVLHQQDDKGTGHVAVAWRLVNNSTRFAVIESSHISLYIHQPGGHGGQIPQTAASHRFTPPEPQEVAVDMKREDPRDTIYKWPLMSSVFLDDVLPDCLYQPTYRKKGQTVGRYKGLYHVHLSYIYPNDYTRLTHLEKRDGCSYTQDLSQIRRPAQTNDKSFEHRWNKSVQVKHIDVQEQRSDRIDLQCTRKGNLLLSSTETLSLVRAFMEKLNTVHPGLFTLVRVINVVKRADGAHGSRYLLEAEVKDSVGRLQRLSRYVYTSLTPTLIGESQPPRSANQPVLCNPVSLQWNPNATVHIVIAVKNQGRWVKHLIAETEKLFRMSKDTNFNLILVDFNSTDLDVKGALQSSGIPRYQYKRLSGNFQRSYGLQSGIDLIEDKHSIIFLFDLQIEFPPSIIDAIRKYTVEGHMVFAPIVMRLDCGSTSQEAKGFWGVHGFGLLGIYKSDLDAAGGMNTREFTDRWGGEDWELIDRVIQAGLEVERLYLRNFFHHYHSKHGMWNN